MTVRMPAVLVVMLSLVAPPLVGIACGLMCDTGHPHSSAGAHHDPHDGATTGHAHDMADTTGLAGAVLTGEHVCDHGLGVVDVFGPSGEKRSPLPSVAAVLLPTAAPAAGTAVATWSQPLERVLGPPTRSPVLRI